MKPNQEKEKGKQAYVKPRLRIVELAAEEVLGIGCKTWTGDPRGANPPLTGCLISPCSSVEGT